MTLALVFGVATGAASITMNGDYKVFFSRDNPQLAAFEALQGTYSKDDNILIALEPADGDVFTPATLAAVDEVVEAGWRIPFATRVEAITNFQAIRANGDDLYVDDLIGDARSLTPEQARAARTAAMSEPQLTNRLLSPQGDITAVNITLKLPGLQIGEEFRAIDAVRKVVDQLSVSHPDMRVYSSGLVMLFGGFSEVMERDMATLIPLTLLISLAVVAVATRSPAGTVGALFVIVLSVLTAFGIGGFLGVQFTAPIASVPTMIMTLAIADSVHISADVAVRRVEGPRLSAQRRRRAG